MKAVGAGLLAALVVLAAPAVSSAAVSSVDATAIASDVAVVRAELRAHPHAYPVVSDSDGEWQVGFFARSTEIVEVLVAKSDGQVLGAYTGYAVAWTMARGYPGQFGGTLDALYVWLPLSLAFVAPFLQWRRPLALVNLDLFALSAFSISLAFFNNADIAASVPLVYPPLVYLLGRALWIALARRAPAKTVLRLAVPVRWLAVAVVVLVVVRIVLNVAASDVIDVGYANLVGAQKVASGSAIYGTFPASIARGDTYGPVSYAAYVPFVELFGFSSGWGALPAAHAAAIFFDLLATLLLFMLGRQIRGPSLGIVLAYVWVAYPFTAFALECNTNDAVLADCVLASLFLARSAPGRGAFSALAALTKIAPLALVPLMLTQRLRETRWRGLVAFGAAFVAVALVASEPAWAHNALATIYRRTLGYQAGRSTPFSVWGLYGGMHAWQTVAVVGAVLLAVVVALLPRREDAVGLAAATAAVLIGVELAASYWFYPYIVWFFAPLAVALFGRHEELLDRVGAQRLRAADQHAHQPGVLVGG